MSSAPFSGCPKLLSQLYILMLNETPCPFCKSCVIVSATPMLGWRECLPCPFPQSGDITAWGLEPTPLQEAEASRTFCGWWVLP